MKKIYTKSVELNLWRDLLKQSKDETILVETENCRFILNGGSVVSSKGENLGPVQYFEHGNSSDTIRNNGREHSDQEQTLNRKFEDFVLMSEDSRMSVVRNSDFYGLPGLDFSMVEKAG